MSYGLHALPFIGHVVTGHSAGDAYQAESLGLLDEVGELLAVADGP
ncbi:hypothetical protein QNO09_01955 [Streptomyces sp. 378]|nr:hypothetical protein [Streptomyces sp. 378]MDK1342098.1 hypothetical protein [Streptomyces sp. 378]